MASADDPEAALEAERATSRKGMAASRTHVGPVERLFRAFLKLNAQIPGALT